MVATRVGNNQGNCTDTNWECSDIDDTNVGSDSSLQFSPDGIPFVSFDANGSGDLRIAQYVGSGGSCSNPAWDCTTIDATDDTGEQTSLSFDRDGNPWVAYEYATGEDLRVAEFIGDGLQSSCAGGSADWRCYDVNTTVSIEDPQIAFDAAGVAMVAYRDSTSNQLEVAQFVGSGGDCDSTQWECTSITTTGSLVVYPGLAFGQNGEAWISHQNLSGDDSLYISKMKLPETPLGSEAGFAGNASAFSGDAQHSLDPGTHPLTNLVQCDANQSFQGYCGLRSDDGYYDTVEAKSGERPLFTYAFRSSINTELPTIEWTGRSSLAPSASGDDGDIHLEIFRYGTTNGWEALASDSSASDCDTVDCVISGQPSGTVSEYFEAEDGEYWVHIRVYQIEGNSSINFRTDEFDTYNTGSRLRGGQRFEDEVRTPFR